MAFHNMSCEAENSNEVLFVCNEAACGRRVVVGKGRPRLTVIDQGDFSVQHFGSLGGISINAVVVACFVGPAGPARPAGPAVTRGPPP